MWSEVHVCLDCIRVYAGLDSSDICEGAVACDDELCALAWRWRPQAKPSILAVAIAPAPDVCFCRHSHMAKYV